MACKVQNIKPLVPRYTNFSKVNKKVVRKLIKRKIY